MVDYSYWDKFKSFTLKTVAYLWAEMEPMEGHKLPPRVAECYHLLLTAVERGELVATNLYPHIQPPTYDVTRSHLEAWANREGYEPPFLLPQVRQLAPAKASSETTAKASNEKYENLLKAFGLLVRAYVGKGEGKYGTKDSPNIFQIAMAIEQEAENLGLLESAKTGLRKSTLHTLIKKALQFVELGR